LYKSIRTNNSAKSKREIPKEYKIEIQALEQCCQHRTHCLVYDITGLIKVEEQFYFNPEIQKEICQLKFDYLENIVMGRIISLDCFQRV